MDKRTTLLALLVTGALAITTGCSVEKPSDDAGRARACGAGKDFLIGMSQANNAEPYRQVMNNDVQTAAKSVPGFRVVVSDAAQDNSKQVADVENFLTQKINLLIISPNEAKPLTAVVKKAYDQGVPVIVLDRKVEGEAYTAFIGGDNVAIGKAAGEFYATRLLPDAAR
nr:substrate-binding domain-containing protein [Micromonospora provocatoris]